jgi:hypothetical protein
MGEKKPNPITIDGTEYDYNDLTEEQQALFNHCVDLDRKIGNTQFNMDQLMVGKEAFMARLKATLESKKD